MKTSRSRLLAITGATLALTLAGTAAVSAHPGDRGEGRGFGFERGPMLGQNEGLPGPGGLRDQLRLGFGDGVDQFVRRESTIETADGVTVHRVDNGTVAATSDSGLDYTLATGETASVTTDEDTTIVALSEQSVEVGRRGISRMRMVPEQITLADIAAGSDIVVWADSSDGSSFVAQRIVVQPEATAADDASDAATDEATDATSGADDAALAPVVDA